MTLKVIKFVFVWTMCWLLNGTYVGAQQLPNIVLVIADDVSWDDLACYGNPSSYTPHLDLLATMGVRFDNAYLTTSSCSPSRASIISGRYPHNTGAPELHDTLPAGQLMFPQLLKDAGYYTALSGKNHMGPQTKYAFDLISNGGGPGGQEDWKTIIENRPKEKPFFFWFAAHDAHRDWQIDDTGVSFDPDSIYVPPMLYDGPVTRRELAAYYHEVSRLDYYVGQLVSTLKNEGLWENTYLLFMSDNGRPFPRCKVRLYDSGIKTPLLITGPNVNSAINQNLISAIDIAPTILTLARIDIDNRIQGKSFAQLLFADDYSLHRDFVFAEHNWHVFQAHERMLRYKEWVYICNAFPERPNYAAESTRHYPAGAELWDAYENGLTDSMHEDIFLQSRPIEELYNVHSDPHQFNNLVHDPDQGERIAFLRKVMDQWIQDTGDSVPTNPTEDRDDINGKRLPKKWKKGERPGEIFNATERNQSGPITLKDVI